MYYSPDDVIRLLDSLRNRSEDEVVEYKEAKSSFGDKELGKYLSALSNEALLRGKDDAWLFFGIEDEFQGVCGTNYRLGNPKGLQNLKRDMAGRTSQRLTFREIHELDYDGKRVIAFQIPAAIPGIPTAYNDACWAREGEHCAPLPTSTDNENKFPGIAGGPRRSPVFDIPLEWGGRRGGPYAS